MEIKDILASPRQLEALHAGETRVVVVKEPGGVIQKGDRVILSVTDTGELPFGGGGVFGVFRVHPGTKDNGILPGFCVLELTGENSMIAHRRGDQLEGAAAPSKGRARKGKGA